MDAMERGLGTGPLESQVRVRRLQAGLSQQALADQAGLTRQAIGAIEGGKDTPNTAVARRLARILRCRVEDLFELPEGGEERDVEVVAPASGPATGYQRADAAAVRAVVAYARGRWVA